MNHNLFKISIISLLILNLIIIYRFNVVNMKIYNDRKEKKLRKKLKVENISYKEMFQLYIENRKKYYIKGREYVMKIGGKNFNESNIVTFQDKLNYLLIHESPENKTNIVDKILLRNYSKNILGKDICAPILKIYNDIEEINLDELPDKFVLKCNHGSLMNIFCEDKSKFDLQKAKDKLRKWMTINYGLISFEYQYLNIKKKVFAEKFLDNEIINYKFSCFNGEPKFIRVKGVINGTNLYNIYYTNWTITNIELSSKKYILTNIFQKPINLQLMLDYARLLSSGFCFCRVDFYEVKGVLYLGEMTFTPFNAHIKYKNNETDIYFGNLINISKIKSN